jgi:hypothetical protein
VTGVHILHSGCRNVMKVIQSIAGCVMGSGGFRRKRSNHSCRYRLYHPAIQRVQYVWIWISLPKNRPFALSQPLHPNAEFGVCP